MTFKLFVKGQQKMSRADLGVPPPEPCERYLDYPAQPKKLALVTFKF